MSGDLGALLGKRADQIERPQSLPGGEYVLEVKKREATKSSQKKTDGQEFTFGIVAPHESVDRDALDKVKNWRARELRDTFWITEASLWRLAGGKNLDGSTQDGFFQHLGISTEGKSVLECLSECIGRQVLATITQEMGDGGNTFNKITKYQRV